MNYSYLKNGRQYDNMNLGYNKRENFAMSQGGCIAAAAAVGAGVGTVVPGIGTFIGAVVGGVTGAVACNENDELTEPMKQVIDEISNIYTQENITTVATESVLNVTQNMEANLKINNIFELEALGDIIVCGDFIIDQSIEGGVDLAQTLDVDMINNLKSEITNKLDAEATQAVDQLQSLVNEKKVLPSFNLGGSDVEKMNQEIKKIRNELHQVNRNEVSKSISENFQMEMISTIDLQNYGLVKAGKNIYQGCNITVATNPITGEALIGPDGMVINEFKASSEKPTLNVKQKLNYEIVMNNAVDATIKNWTDNTLKNESKGELSQTITQDQDQEQKAPPFAKIFGAIGGLIFFGCIVGCIVFLIRRYKKKKWPFNKKTEQTPTGFGGNNFKKNLLSSFGIKYNNKNGRHTYEWKKMKI
jgi:hypothetical protein